MTIVWRARPTRAVALLAAMVMAVAWFACRSPTSPSGSAAYGYLVVYVFCDRFGSDPLLCRAEARCSGYSANCPRPELDRADVTNFVVWTSDNPSVARVVSPGRITGAGVGDTVIHVKSPEYPTMEDDQPVSVLAGYPPMPTREIWGLVFRAGETPSSSYIPGAVIEVLDGAVAGRTATSGVPPPLLPGYYGSVGFAGQYRLLGIPPGTYAVRVTAEGYRSETYAVSVVPDLGGMQLNMALVRQ